VKPRRLHLHRLRGDLYAFWAVTMTALLLVFAMVVVVGRYYSQRGQAQAAADAAALAAGSQIDIAAYENGQGVQFTPGAFDTANLFMLMNCEKLFSMGSTCRLVSVTFDESRDSVRVTVVADLVSPFPKLIPPLTVTVIGYSEVAPFSQ